MNRKYHLVRGITERSNTEGLQTMSGGLKNDRIGHTIKVRQSRNPLNKLYLKHFVESTRG